MAKEKRLIDAYKLEDLLRSNSGRYHHKDDIIAAIAGQPTVDVVEVVRCKDCKHWSVDQYGCVCNLHSEKENADYPAFEVQMLPTDFCSYGERRSDGSVHI